MSEWLCIGCDTVYPGPPQPGTACVMCPKCGGGTGPRARMELMQARAENERIGAMNVALLNALREISLCSKNSASSKEECGVIARNAINRAA